MSVDTDDGRRSKRGYARARVADVDVYLSGRLALYGTGVILGMKRGLFGRRLSLDFIPRPAADCPE